MLATSIYDTTTIRSRTRSYDARVVEDRMIWWPCRTCGHPPLNSWWVRWHVDTPSHQCQVRYNALSATFMTRSFDNGRVFAVRKWLVSTV